MGFRFHKSFNLGNGFRLNLSKSGVGYSWGVKGFRIGKRAGSNGGCAAFIIMPIWWICLLMWWMIKYTFLLMWWLCYGTIWLFFILPIKSIIKLCKKPSNSNADNRSMTKASDITLHTSSAGEDPTERKDDDLI